jgi:hypothetical protein
VSEFYELSILTHFFKELVTNVSTSWFSSSNNIVPRYPNRLSANRGDARSLRHSICPKCVLSPRVKRYKSFATLFRLYSIPSAGDRSPVFVSYLTFESPLSSRKLARIAALSFCTTARSSAMVFEARTLRMNCFTANSQQAGRGGAFVEAYESSCWRSGAPQWA